MSNQEMQQYLTAVINTLDELSKKDALRIYGLSELSQFSGCIQAIETVIKNLSTETE